MEKIIRNPPAFPVTAPNGDKYSGVTTLEYFAAQALQGILANERNNTSANPLVSKKHIAASVQYATALLKATQEAINNETA